MKALDGIRVLDLSRVLAGPYCAQLLADMGAEVIKVESPKGDENRHWPPFAEDGESCNFGSVNRGKRAMTLNLKAPEASNILEALIKSADVVIHNFLPHRAARLGIEYDTMRKINPRIIFCSITGYGENGPLRDKPGYDLTMQAFTGAMSTMGFKDGPPVRSGVSFIDMSTGISAYGAILTALFARERTGRGTWVRLSLLETGVALLGYHAIAWLQGGRLPTPQGSGTWHLVPYQAFKCTDGFLLAAANNDLSWRNFCAALGVPDLAEDERFIGNENRRSQRDVLIPMLEAIFETGTVAQWTEAFEARGVAVAPMQTLDQVFGHPQVLANDMVVEGLTADGRTVPLVGTPFKLADGGGVAATAPPRVGADTEAILSDILSFTPDRIRELREAEVI